MEVSVENTSTLGRRLKVSVPNATINEQIQAKIAKLAKSVRLKGYSSGRKIPHHVLEKKFGSSVRTEVINELIRQSFGRAVKENELQLAGLPKIEEVTNQIGQNLEYVATFEVYPHITLESLTDVEIERRTVTITETDVQNMIVKLCNQLADWDPVERAAQKDDKLTVDFARKLQEENAKREEQKNVQMVIGVEGVVPGLSEKLIGKQKGEEIEIEVQYPQNWADTHVAGKKAQLWVKIHEIFEKKILTEEKLADKFGLLPEEQENLALKVKERMQEELNATLQDEIKEKVLEKLLEKNKIELPIALIEQEKEAIHKEMSRSQSKNPQETLAHEDLETSAKKRVELGLLLNEVIKKYEIKVDGTKVRNEIEKIATRFSRSTEVTDAYYKNKELLHGIERMVLLEQAVDVLLKEMKVEEKQTGFDEVMNSPSVG